MLVIFFNHIKNFLGDLIIFTMSMMGVPCKRRISVSSGSWLRIQNDVTRVAKTNILW